MVVGQKTGFFLDQRDNRARVGRWCTRLPPAQGPRVLNVFGYTGGFSIYAGRCERCAVMLVYVTATCGLPLVPPCSCQLLICAACHTS